LLKWRHHVSTSTPQTDYRTHTQESRLQHSSTPALHMSPGTIQMHKQFSQDTQAVHAGQNPDPITGAVIPALSLSTTFAQPAPGQPFKYDYSRSGNPNRDAFETAVAALEGADYGIAFASGSAATTTILHLLNKGGHVISVNDVYGGTARFFRNVAPSLGLEVSFVELAGHEDDIVSHLRPDTKLVWIETPTNPTLRVIDIARISALLAAHGTILVVDNTFMSPIFQQPLSLGADIVVHSGTKYLNGHSDVVIGIACTNSLALSERLRFLQNALGAVPSPFDCFMANRGLKTLHLRMRRHEKNALAVAKFLSNSTNVEEVFYPGLESHPQHATAKKQQHGFGGMIAFRIRGDSAAAATRFLQHCQLFVLAESLGGVESLAESPALMTHAGVPQDHRNLLGITDGLIRLSCGIESPEDLVEDIRQALAFAVESVKN